MKNLPAKLAVVPTEKTLAERVAEVVGRKLDDDKIDALRAILVPAKTTRVAGSNPDSVANLTKRYNALVPTAKKLEITGVKVHTSNFGTVAGGKQVLAALETKIAEAQAKLAETENAEVQARASGC